MLEMPKISTVFPIGGLVVAWVALPVPAIQDLASSISPSSKSAPVPPIDWGLSWLKTGNG